jgi:hypothetical protein
VLLLDHQPPTYIILYLKLMATREKLPSHIGRFQKKLFVSIWRSSHGGRVRDRNSTFSPPWGSDGRVSRSDQDVSCAAKLFDLLWESIADVLGTAATATLLRRAIKRAASQISWPEPIAVARNGLDYEYHLPETWKQPGNEEAIDALRVVAAELRVLLVELTGPVVVRRLARLAPFRKLGIDFSEEAK